MKKAGGWLDQNIVVVVLFICAVLQILLCSLALGAEITYDSGFYLREAQTLLDGNGLHVNAAAGDTAAVFSIWPIGYPAMIAAVSFVTRLPVLPAARLLSVLLLAVITALLVRRFRGNTWLFSLLFLNTGFLLIFRYTWSEQPFLLGLLWLCLALEAVLTREKASFFRYFSVAAAGLFCFLSRYIGAFSVGVTGLAALWCLIVCRREKPMVRRGLWLLCCCAAQALPMAGYLFLNLKNSGYLTGSAKIAPLETYGELLRSLWDASVAELNHMFGSLLSLSPLLAALLWLGAAAFFAVAFLRRRTPREVLPGLLLVTGVCYFGCIVILRFRSLFDPFGYRLLLPATALLFFAFFAYLLRDADGFRAWTANVPRVVRIGICAVCAAALLWTPGKAALTRIRSGEPQALSGWRTAETAALTTYQEIPGQCAVLYAQDSRANYLRCDITFTHPFFTESLSDFRQRLSGYDAVYVDTDGLRASLDGRKVTPDVYKALAPYLETAEKFALVRL